MLFFQLCLLLGYAYAHISSRYLQVTQQAILHIILLIIAALVIPAGIGDEQIPPENYNPAFWQLSLMAGSIGLPFLILSASAPMLQRWFSYTDHKDAQNPYFLYGASNLGSMSGLLLYPVLIEPALTLNQQNYYWFFGFVLLIGGVALCSFVSSGKGYEDRKKISISIIKPIQRLRWIYWAFIPSALMLVVTTYITTDIASVPLFWVVPLALYLGSFIIAFSRKRLITLEKTSILFGLSVLALVIMELLADYSAFATYAAIVLHLVSFFLAGLLCHCILYAHKPEAGNLTEFYFFISMGGAIGGFFSAIIVPNLFILPVEYVLIMLMALLVRFQGQGAECPDWKDCKVLLLDNKFLVFIVSSVLCYLILASSVTTYALIAFIAFYGIAVCLLVKSRVLFTIAILPVFFFQTSLIRHDSIYYNRNFFGFMNVTEVNGQRYFVHGSTIHGTQLVEKGMQKTLTAYYVDGSPVSEIFKILNASGAKNIAILGLGIGGLSCFSEEGMYFDFFEIDENVAEVAQNPDLFTYLSDCAHNYNIILGDGRLKIAEQPDQKYDAIFLDAFSSDSVPIHLMTLEAAKTYMDKLSDDGVLIYHISNRYLDLEPVLAELSQALDIPARTKFGVLRKIKGTDILGSESHYVVLTKSSYFLGVLDKVGWDNLRKRQGVKLWTDQYSNILSVLYPQTTNARRAEETAKIKAATKKN